MITLRFRAITNAWEPGEPIMIENVVMDTIFIIIRNTELAQAVDVMMARAKRVCILIIKVSKPFTFRRIFRRKHVFHVSIEF